MSLWSRFERRLGDLAGELVLDGYRDQLNHARELLAEGQIQEAIDVLEALLAAQPTHGQALIALGGARLAMRDPQHAFDAFERALEVRKGDPLALVGLGHSLVELGKYEQSISPLARAVAESRGDRAVLADAYRGLGIAWRRLGDFDKAVRELRKAVAEDGDDMEARAALGEALVSDGRTLDEARRHLDRAAAQAEAPAVAHYALGKLALVEGALGVASDRLSTARSMAEADSTPLGMQVRFDILVALGDAAFAEGKADRAHELYAEAVQLQPRSAIVHARIAAAHRSAANFEAALASYDRVLALEPSAEALAAAVDVAIAAGDTVRGQQWSADLLAKNPHHVRAIVARGLAFVPSQPDAARALLEIAAVRGDLDAQIHLARMSLRDLPFSSSASATPGHGTAGRDAALGAASAALVALRASPHHDAARELLRDARAIELGLDRAPARGVDDIAALADFVSHAVAARRELGHLVADVARSGSGLDQPLLVTVMGEFSSGKSSFVNAFIGGDVAATGVAPTTATINVVRYGRERAGRIIGLDGGVSELSWDRLMQYLRTLTPEEARRIDRVEILVPLPQLEKINIVDTPGLNSIQREHEQTARGFIARADAIVWVFTAGQGGKASERQALQEIRAEGKRILGVLNKTDQLSSSERDEVCAYLASQLGDAVETIVPVSARQALAWRTDPAHADGNWPALAAALEERFFQQARRIKRAACAQALRAVIANATTELGAARTRSERARAAAFDARERLADSARAYASGSALAERKQLSDALGLLYRRAAREVLDLIRPRRLPFSSHSATAADRDYVISLLASGFESAIASGRKRVGDELQGLGKLSDAAAKVLADALGVDVVGDMERVAADQIGLALSQVFDRAHAYLRGYVEGGYVDSFFKNDVPHLELSEDAIYHALYRAAPDVDRQIGEPLGRAASHALLALAERLDHWQAVIEVAAFDLDVGVGRALEIAAERLADYE